MKKAIFVILVVSAIILFAGCVEHEKSTEFKYGVKYRALVVKVIDGDTVDVLINGEIKRIRLLGVDAPEKSPKRNKPNEYDAITNLSCLSEWGWRAKNFTFKMLHNKNVYIEFDEIAGLKGYYRRYLAYIYLENGTDFNELLIKNGLARVYKEGKFKKERHYILLEKQAIRNKVGLWKCS